MAKRKSPRSRTCSRRFKKASIQHIRPDFKNKHLNGSCVVVGTGPSLLETDLSCLEDNLTIGVNDCDLLTDVKFNYFCVSDPRIWRIKGPRIKSFVEKNQIPLFLRDDMDDPPFLHVPVKTLPSVPENYFWDDIQNSGACLGPSVTIMAMQVAAYMGIDTIFLIGCDCTFDGHFYDPSPCESHRDFTRYFQACRIIKDHADRTGVRILNATVGGNLDVFPRASIDDFSQPVQ